MDRGSGFAKRGFLLAKYDSGHPKKTIYFPRLNYIFCYTTETLLQATFKVTGEKLLICQNHYAPNKSQLFDKLPEKWHEKSRLEIKYFPAVFWKKLQHKTIAANRTANKIKLIKVFVFMLPQLRHFSAWLCNSTASRVEDFLQRASCTTAKY